MPIENERKYHLKDINPSTFRNRLINLGIDFTQQKIYQSYLVHDRQRGFVERVRCITVEGEPTYIVTKKIGFGENCREVETIISYEQYCELMEFFTIGDTICKTRYVIPTVNGTKWEVDIYSGAHTGTVVAEIELPTPDTEIVFHHFLGDSKQIIDVTDDKTFKNWYMAGIGIKN